MEKTKIIATLGPSSISEEMVVKMDHLGVDLFRINLSHTVISDLEGLVRRVQGWSDKKICIDTEGAQLRTGGLKNDFLQIDTAESIRIGGPLNDEKDEIIPLNVKNPNEKLRVGDLLKIDFDSALVQITDIEKFHLVLTNRLQLLLRQQSGQRDKSLEVEEVFPGIGHRHYVPPIGIRRRQQRHSFQYFQLKTTLSIFFSRR